MAEIVKIGLSGGEPPGEQPDAYGQAALILVESLMHALVEIGMFTTEKAVEIIAVAQDVKEEKAKDTGEAAETLARSLDLLNQMATSFAADVRD